jgi:shikimate kinase
MESAPNLVLVGAMGAGKSSIGKRVAERLQLCFVDADRDIELHTGASIGTIFDCEGEAGFRQRERTALTRLLANQVQVIATGGGVVLDADNRRDLRERGFVVWLQVDVPTQLQRLSRDRSRPLLQREDREQVLRDLAAARAPLYTVVADLAFDTADMGCAAAAQSLALRLRYLWACPAAATATAHSPHGTNTGRNPP